MYVPLDVYSKIERLINVQWLMDEEEIYMALLSKIFDTIPNISRQPFPLHFEHSFSSIYKKELFMIVPECSFLSLIVPISIVSDWLALCCWLKLHLLSAIVLALFIKLIIVNYTSKYLLEGYLLFRLIYSSGSFPISSHQLSYWIHFLFDMSSYLAVPLLGAKTFNKRLEKALLAVEGSTFKILDLDHKLKICLHYICSKHIP
ncbi:hypothetical protein BD560DRAFT_424752 [Blakeslea trispora]|nr:hypothetical protein BD560DRAFT_424752 [Blakeslea trispora]